MLTDDNYVTQFSGKQYRPRPDCSSRSDCSYTFLPINKGSGGDLRGNIYQNQYGTVSLLVFSVQFTNIIWQAILLFIRECRYLSYNQVSDIYIIISLIWHIRYLIY